MIYTFNADGYFLQALEDDPKTTLHANFTTIAPPLENYTSREYVRFKFDIYQGRWEVIAPDSQTIATYEKARKRTRDLLRYQKNQRSKK